MSASAVEPVLATVATQCQLYDATWDGTRGRLPIHTVSAGDRVLVLYADAFKPFWYVRHRRRLGYIERAALSVDVELLERAVTASQKRKALSDTLLVLQRRINLDRREVTAPAANVHTEPNQNAEVLFAVSGGADVGLLRRKGDWCMVAVSTVSEGPVEYFDSVEGFLKDARIGWIRSSMLLNADWKVLNDIDTRIIDEGWPPPGPSALENGGR